MYHRVASWRSKTEVDAAGWRMGLLLLLGTFLVALGPAAAVFVLVVAPHANLVVVSILSAFFWVCSISVAALLWLALPSHGSGGVTELVLAVLLQV